MSNPEYMGSMQPTIYQRRQAGGLYKDIDKFDLIDYFKPVLDNGSYYVSPHGTIRRNKAIDAQVYETPWHHVKPCPFKQCNIDHQIKFNMLGYIPPRCLECWKVVVGPRTLKELFTLVDVEKKLDRPSKAGIEMRAYTGRPYGGYFYNNSLDEGMECYKTVREAVDESISPDVPVLLKRGCTEYEFIAGDSRGWFMNDYANELDNVIETLVEDDAKSNLPQPEIITRHVHKRWIEYAHKLGDQTYLEYTDGKSLYPSYYTYHDKDINETKVEMCSLRAQQVGQLPDAVTRHILWQMGGLMDNADTNRRTLGAAMGFHNVDPFSIYEHSTYPF